MRRIAALLLASLSLAACAGKDSGTDTTKVAQSDKADGPRVVTVTARDFAYAISDTIQSGMTTFRLINEARRYTTSSSLVSIAERPWPTSSPPSRILGRRHTGWS